MIKNIKTLTDDLAEDSFICTQEDCIKTLSSVDEEVRVLNGVFTFEEVNPALSYPVLDTIPKGTILARLVGAQGFSDTKTGND